MSLNEKIEKLEREFNLHMQYEYPQIDRVTRGYLARELALLAVSE